MGREGQAKRGAVGAGLLALLLVGGLGCATSGGGWREALDAYQDGRYEDAELIWLEVLAQSEASGEGDPRYAQSLRMLGNLYIQTGRYDQARPVLERWIEVREQRGDISGVDYADGVDALAGVYLGRGRIRLGHSFLRARPADP